MDFFMLVILVLGLVAALVAVLAAFLALGSVRRKLKEEQKGGGNE